LKALRLGGSGSPPPPLGIGHRRVRVEIMGSQKCRTVGRSQPVLIVIHPMIFTRTRTNRARRRRGCGCGATPDSYGGVSASRLPAADGRYAEIFEVDDVIDPADTRFWLVRSLEACPPVKG
jgi:hypothetical protein